jgi:hypothetical protein
LGSEFFHHLDFAVEGAALLFGVAVGLMAAVSLGYLLQEFSKLRIYHLASRCIS